MHLERDDLEGLNSEWLEVAMETSELFYKKHQSYGPDNISATGLPGVVVRMWDKINRLRRLVLEGAPEALDDETLEDTLMDIADYAIIGLLVHRGIWPEYEGGQADEGSAT